MKKNTIIISFFFSICTFAQESSPEIKTIDEVIQGIDDLLSGVDAAKEDQKYTDPSKTLLMPTNQTLDRPFRLENELMPPNLQPTENPDSTDLGSGL